jgi:NAD+ kinase
MKIALHGRPLKDSAIPCVKYIFSELKRRGASMQVYEPFGHFVSRLGVPPEDFSVFNRREQLADVDFFFSIGGDGTLLESLTFVGDRQIPILGINAGRLGFLAGTLCTDIDMALNQLFGGEYRYDDRTLLRMEANRELFGGVNFALNEFTITKRDTASMIVVNTYIDGEYLNSYWADGLIVATPTGSTGYSLSCGGPVIMPDSGNFIIAPVSPHNLNVRPIIVSDNSVISFQIEGRSKNFLVSLDSRSKSVDATIKLSVRKEHFKARLIKLPGQNFLHTLRAKLNWGLDTRN